MPERTILLSGMPAGSARAQLSKPSQSRLPTELSGIDLLVAFEYALRPYAKSSTARFGNFSGWICTRPPANSADRAGEYDLLTCTLSSRPAGNRSSGTTFLSGSVVGNVDPDSVVLL